ncbi:hypothetical protein [Mesorhizobium loti]|uniref:hypothetical protein n=1 Tax=Rhizobium loti TaxID=381 RepID=UPI000B002C85|nr:hypothetical protein [Mesorhizobium loti]
MTRIFLSVAERSQIGRCLHRHGLAINDAQNGEQHLAVKALKGFGGRILAVADDLDRDTYRAVHAVASLV